MKITVILNNMYKTESLGREAPQIFSFILILLNSCNFHDSTKIIPTFEFQFKNVQKFELQKHTLFTRFQKSTI